jgi:hypothetical protein
MGDGMSSGFFKEETAKKNTEPNTKTLSRAGDIFLLPWLLRVFRCTLGIRLGHFR